MDLVYSYIAFVIAYLIGSLSFAVIVSRTMGLADPRTYGSNNPGATNVLRSGNKKAAILTLLFDALKGWVPVAFVQWKSFELHVGDPTIAFVGLFAFLGHLFPVFFRFKGGKGVATAAGVLLAYEPLLGLGTLLIWVAVAALFRYSSLASLVAAVFAPFCTLMFFNRPNIALAVTIMCLLLIWRHWRNITKLLSGKESKIGAKADEAPMAAQRRRHRVRLHNPNSANRSSHSSHSSKGK